VITESHCVGVSGLAKRLQF